MLTGGISIPFLISPQCINIVAMSVQKSVGVHFVGIGGIGMSALARYFLSVASRGEKMHISGSDVVASDITRSLAKEGIKIHIGHRTKNIGRDVRLVIYNRAIKPGNPELVAARKRGIPITPYATVLGSLTEYYKTIAVTGSHGKTTTTAFAGLVVKAGGFDPTILIGTKLKELNGKNIRIGKSPFLVLEADDFGAAFLEYHPLVSIVTNIDKEHLDFYKTFARTKAAFLAFLARTKPGGAMILNRDDAPLRALRKKIAKIAKKKKLRTIWYSVHGPQVKRVAKKIKIFGVHNLSNASAAYALGYFMGIPEKKILSAIGAYHGAWRRMEPRGKFHGALVFDDYAHHPTEIKATLRAVREHYPKKKILCVFQPHQAKRLSGLFNDFVGAFDDVDELLIVPTYKVAGRDTEKSGRDALALSRRVQKRSRLKTVMYLAKKSDLVKTIRSFPAPLSSKIIIMMGAGDVIDMTSGLV